MIKIRELSLLEYCIVNQTWLVCTKQFMKNNKKGHVLFKGKLRFLWFGITVLYIFFLNTM